MKEVQDIYSEISKIDRDLSQLDFFCFEHRLAIQGLNHKKEELNRTLRGIMKNVDGSRNTTIAS